jgi:hypothetical protein
MTPGAWHGQQTYMGGAWTPKGGFGGIPGGLAGGVGGRSFGGFWGQPQVGGQIGYPFAGLGGTLPFQGVPPILLPYGAIGVEPQLASHLPFQSIPSIPPFLTLTPGYAAHGPGTPGYLPSYSAIVPFASGGQWAPQSFMGNQISGLAGLAGQTGGPLPFQTAPVMAACA